jgi:hypothetical protein
MYFISARPYANSFSLEKNLGGWLDLIFVFRVVKNSFECLVNSSHLLFFSN